MLFLIHLHRTSQSYNRCSPRTLSVSYCMRVLPALPALPLAHVRICLLMRFGQVLHASLTSRQTDAPLAIGCWLAPPALLRTRALVHESVRSRTATKGALTDPRLRYYYMRCNRSLAHPQCCCCCCTSASPRPKNIPRSTSCSHLRPWYTVSTPCRKSHLHTPQPQMQGVGTGCALPHPSALHFSKLQ